MLVWLQARERAIEGRSAYVEGIITDVREDRFIIAYEADGRAMRAIVPFSKDDVEGVLEDHERVALLVDEADPSRVHMPGNDVALIGESAAGMLRAAPVVVLAGAIIVFVSVRRFLRFRHALVRYPWSVVELVRQQGGIYVRTDVAGPVHHFECRNVLPRRFTAHVAAPALGSGLFGRPCVIRPLGTDHLVAARGPIATAPGVVEPTWQAGRVLPRPELPLPGDLGQPPGADWLVRGDTIGFTVHHGARRRDGAPCGIWTFDGEFCGWVLREGSNHLMADATGRIVIEREDRHREVTFVDGDRDVGTSSAVAVQLTSPELVTWTIRRRRREVVVADAGEPVAHGIVRTRFGHGRTACVVLAAGLDPPSRRIALLQASIELGVPTPDSSD